MRNIDQKYYCSNYYASVNIYGVKFGTSLKIWENSGWINKIDPSWGFQCYFRYFLGRRSLDDERQINRWKGIATRFKGKLIKIGLALVNVDQIVMSDKFKHDEDGFKHFIDYKEDDIAGLLCIILPQMRWYIKCFENGGKNMSFIIKDDDDVLVKYNDIWNKIKKILNIKFHGMSVYYENT